MLGEITILVFALVSCCGATQPWGHVTGDVRPFHYNLYIKPDIYGTKPANTLEGRVSIYVEVIKATDEFQYHDGTSKQDGANPQLCRVAGVDEVECDKFKVISVKTTSALVRSIVFDGVLSVGKYVMHLSFKTQIQTHPYGVYVSKEPNGIVLTTQFEPTMARLMFPCVDQPDMKATYNITVARKHPYIALSNAPLMKSTERPDGWVIDDFEPTVPMPTYIVSISVIKGYSVAETQSSSGIKVGVWSDAQHGKTMSLYKEIPKLLDYFEDYTQVPYGMKKYDNVGFTNYAAGAMENWGLVTWLKGQMMHGMVLAAHETAHQWMGNMVTAADWGFVWFQEAAARYYEDISLRDVFGMSQHDVALVNTLPRSFLPALEEDATGVSRAVVEPIENGGDLYEALRAHVYNKGSYIYQMINHILGDNNFREMWRRICKKFRYSSINFDQYADELQKLVSSVGDRHGDKSSFNAHRFLTTWLRQPGIPVVTVTRQNTGMLNITQKRLYIGNNPEGVKNHIWDIPLTLSTKDTVNSNQKDGSIVWVNNAVIDVELDEMTSSGFVVGDVSGNGYYLMNYDEANWKAIGQSLVHNTETLPTISRIRHWIGLWYLVQSGDVTLFPVLEMSRYMVHESDEYCWRYLGKIMEYILAAFYDYSNLVNYIHKLTSQTSAVYSLKYKLDFEKNAFDARTVSGSDISLMAGLINRYIRGPPNEAALLALYDKLIDNHKDGYFSYNLEKLTPVTFSREVITKLEGLTAATEVIDPKLVSTIDKAVSKIASNVVWKEENLIRLEDFLKST